MIPDMIYPDYPIPPRNYIEKACRICGGTEELMQDPLTKDWWHQECRKVIHRVTVKEAISHVNKKPWGRDYPKENK